MRNVVTFLVLLLHVNTTMFFPVVEETMAFDKKGKPIDDVTSIVEFVDQVLLEHEDNTPLDKEEDQRAHFFSAFKIGYYIATQEILITPPARCETDTEATYSELAENHFPIVSYDILTPPPKA